MRSAKFILDKQIFFDLLGLKYFDARIDSIGVMDDNIFVYVSGSDERMPDGDDHKSCELIGQTTVSFLKEIN